MEQVLCLELALLVGDGALVCAAGAFLVSFGDMSCPDWLSKDTVPFIFLLILLFSLVDLPAGLDRCPYEGVSEVPAILVGQSIWWSRPIH